MGKNKPRVKLPPTVKPLKENTKPARLKDEPPKSQEERPSMPPSREVAIDESGRLAWPDSHKHLFPAVMFAKHHPHAPVYASFLPWTDTQHLRHTFLRLAHLFDDDPDAPTGKSSLIWLMKNGNASWNLTFAQVADLYERFLRYVWQDCMICMSGDRFQEEIYASAQKAALKQLEEKGSSSLDELDGLINGIDKSTNFIARMSEGSVSIPKPRSEVISAKAARGSQTMKRPAPLPKSQQSSQQTDPQDTMFGFSQDGAQLLGAQSTIWKDFTDYVIQNPEQVEKFSMGLGAYDPKTGTLSYHGKKCNDECPICAEQEGRQGHIDADRMEKSQAFVDMLSEKFVNLGYADSVKCEITGPAKNAGETRTVIAASSSSSSGPYRSLIVASLADTIDTDAFDLFLSADPALEDFFKCLAEGRTPTLQLGADEWDKLLAMNPKMTKRYLYSRWRAFASEMSILYGSKHKDKKCGKRDCVDCGGLNHHRSQARELLLSDLKRVHDSRKMHKWEGGDRLSVEWSKNKKADEEVLEQRDIKPLPKRTIPTTSIPTPSVPSSPTKPTAASKSDESKPTPSLPDIDFSKPSTKPAAVHPSNAPNFDFGMTNVKRRADEREGLKHAGPPVIDNISPKVSPRKYMPAYLSAGIDMLTISWFLQDVEKGLVDREEAATYRLGRFDKKGMTDILKAELLRRAAFEEGSVGEK